MYIHLVVVDKAQPVAMLKLDIFHNILLLLLFTSCLSVGVKLQPGGNWQIICNTERHTRVC